MIIFRNVGKFRRILSRHQKLRVLELAILMVIGGFLEMLSVSLILPFMNAVMDVDTILENSYVVFVCDLFGIESSRTFLVFLAIVMAVVYIIKNCFLVFQMTVQNKFVYNNMFATQQRLLHSYLMRPYEYYLNVKSADILRVIREDTSNAFNALTTLLQLFTELIVSGVLIVTIFVITPVVTLLMAVLLMGLLLIIMDIIRPTLRRSGEKNRVAGARMNQWLLQSIEGIKELKIMRRENFFEKQYEENGRSFIRTTYIGLTLGMMPRFMIEAGAMGAFFLAVAAMIYQGMDMAQIVPVISAVAIAAIRLLPSVNRISQAMATIAFGEATLDKMIENLTEAEDYEENSQTQKITIDGTRIQPIQKELALRHVTYQYPTGKKPVLLDADMVIHKGESVGIVGASGAGKTTAVDILLGLLQPQSGHILIDGQDIMSDEDGWLSQIGYIPQTIFMLDGDIRDNVTFGLPEEMIQEERIWQALKEAAIDRDVWEFPEGLHTQIGERGIRLSGGQRQRIGIARALFSDPRILFFDEATSALDTETESAIMESIEELHGTKTLIIIAHRLSTIQSCDHIFRVEDGKIIKER